MEHRHIETSTPGQLGTHPHMWLHRICTRELALTKLASARGTTRHNQHMWTWAERHRARVLKRCQGK